MTRPVFVVLALAIGLALLGGGERSTAGGLPVYFVKPAAAGTGDGSSWANATTLAQALGISGDKEIWVASGTYVPVLPSHLPDKRKATFSLGPGDRVYGGFVGTESERDQRDPQANETLLSGAIQTSAVTDNAYTVVTLQAAADATTILDGFTVSDGYNLGGSATGQGGGIRNAGGRRRWRTC